ncbi:MAG: T9SS type A sorting domain-containing protein [Chitinophagaceae bacterium]|nr:T9SS type A sorting domain-containing protein [Chitinophagaceae bacterium]
MKTLLLFPLTLLLWMGTAHAQYWQIPNPNANTNPGSINSDDEYPSGGGLPAGWVTVHSPSATAAWSAAVTLPFAFQFNGTAVTSYKVSNSGILTFDVGTALAAPGFTRGALPNAAIPDNSICIWGLGGLGTNDLVVAKTFGTAPNRQYWIQFSSYGYGTTTSDGSNFTYWSMVLEETSNKIHIVDNRTGGYANADKVSAGVQVNATTAWSVATSPDLVSLAGTDPTPADNSYYTFIPGTPPAYDLAMTAITTPAFVVSGNNNITGTIRNLGSTTITSMDINYTIDGGATVTSTLNSLSIAPLAYYNFTHPTPWNATIGAHTVDAWATNLNGSNADANPGDDHKQKSVFVLSENIQRVPLFEVYTSSTCGPCNPGNANYHSIVNTKPAADYVSVKFQQDFPGTGDPYCTTEAVNRRTNMYGINSIPRMEIDGGWDGNANSFTTQLYDDARAIPAQYKMNGTYNVYNKTVTTKVRFSPLFNATGAKLYVAVLEGKTTANVKSNGETEFFQVMKKMIPTETGTTLPNTAIGSWDSLSFTYTFNGDYRLPTDGQAANRIVHTTEHSVEEFSDLYVVAWIQGANKTVYQAANLTLNIPAGTENLSEAIESVKVYPNPATDVIHVNMNLLQSGRIFATLVDNQGNVVVSKSIQGQTGKNQVEFNTQAVAQGMYHLIVSDARGNSSVQEVVIAH